MSMDVIEKKALAYRQARDVLTERATALHDKLLAAQRESLRGIRNAVAKVTEADADLKAALEQSPELFDKPRSAVFHGVKVGFVKGKGKIEWDDDDQVVRLIRKHFPDQFEVLVKTTEKPVKDSLAQLTAKELKTIGITVESTGDVCFVKDTTAAVDKLVKALLKGAEEDAAES